MFIKKVHMCLLMLMVITIFVSLLSNPKKEGLSIKPTLVTNSSSSGHIIKYADYIILTNNIESTSKTIPKNFVIFTISNTLKDATDGTTTYEYIIKDTNLDIEIKEYDNNSHPIFHRSNNADGNIQLQTVLLKNFMDYTNTANNMGKQGKMATINVTVKKKDASTDPATVTEPEVKTYKIKFDSDGSSKPLCPTGCQVTPDFTSKSKIDLNSVWEDPTNWTYINDYECTNKCDTINGRDDICNAQYINTEKYKSNCQRNTDCGSCTPPKPSTGYANMLKYKDGSSGTVVKQTEPTKNASESDIAFETRKKSIINKWLSTITFKFKPKPTFSGVNGITDMDSFNKEFDQNNQALGTWRSGHQTAIEAGERLRTLATSPESTLDPEGDNASSLSSSLVKYSKMISDSINKHENQYHRTGLVGDDASYTGHSF